MRRMGVRSDLCGIQGGERVQVHAGGARQSKLEGLDVPEFGLVGYPEDAVVTAGAAAGAGRLIERHASVARLDALPIGPAGRDRRLY